MGTVDINNFIAVAQAPAILNGEKNEELGSMKIKKTYYMVSENNRTVKWGDGFNFTMMGV